MHIVCICKRCMHTAYIQNDSSFDSRNLCTMLSDEKEVKLEK